jgi:hypothetical protein
LPKEKGNNYLQNIHIKQKSSNSNTTENRGELRCSGRVGSYFFTSGTSRFKLVTTPVISHGHKPYITKFCPSALYMFVSRVLVFVVFCFAYMELIVEVEYKVEICYLPKLLMHSFQENQIR